MEVVYTGLHQTPEQIVETVVQEDADAVGLSVLSGAHMTLFARLAELLAEGGTDAAAVVLSVPSGAPLTLFPRLAELLQERGIDDVVVFGGGIIPDEDVPELERLRLAPIVPPRARAAQDVGPGGGPRARV